MTREEDRKRGGERKDDLDQYGQRVEARWDKVARARRRRAPDDRPPSGTRMHADDGGAHRF